jgi:hypothetical protein
MAKAICPFYVINTIRLRIAEKEIDFSRNEFHGREVNPLK